MTGNLRRTIGVRGATAINVITMIGIGPLITIPLVLSQLAGPLALIGWICGALVALCDGLVWSELGTRYPGSGGTYAYLREIFGRERWGRLFAFLYNWQFFLSSSLVVATGYIGFANYSGYIFHQVANSPGLNHAVALGVGMLTILLLYRHIGAAARLSVVLAAIAIGTLVVVGLAGFAHADFHRAFSLPQPARFGWAFFAGFGSALYITLYDYAGYSQAAFVAEEIREPQRTLPASIVASVIIVLALYLFVQVGVLGAIPWQTLVGHGGVQPRDAQFVASTVVAHAWGSAAANGVTALILITAFASVYGGLLGNSRVPFAAARDGAFLPLFARLHGSGRFPHLALLGMGAISLIACFFDLSTVIAVLSSAGILVGSIGQIVALFVMHARGERAPFRMWLFPVPALVALAGWLLAYWYTGAVAIGIGIGWLALGAIVFFLLARARRWWPFAATAAAAFVLLLPHAACAQPVGAWRTWRTSRIVQVNGYPIFEVAGRPFFVWGASFFYERVPRGEWRMWLRAYRDGLHVNTVDVYVPWNWQEPAKDELDFTGRTNQRRDLLGLFRVIHSLGLKVVLRPGPVIRNEWRNGGYPAWLLKRPAYDMPLHDVLEGRYPATATLQNEHADAAAKEWLHNATHLRYAKAWLRSVLTALAPYSHDVIAIALDDDQGAYLENDTWPAPHWHEYIDWLKSVVHSVTGSSVPVFINTWQMKVTASSPVWAWGNWYQSSAYRIGEHDRDQLDFSTDLIGTQTGKPIMISEFQAGWLQGADEGAPRGADPTNTALALGELLADGAHGVVNFPVQDTISPAGWEAPWANWAYDWDAAFASSFFNYHPLVGPRFRPTAAFGEVLARWGRFLAATHRVADAGVIWPPSLYEPSTQTPQVADREAAATMALLRDCRERGLACSLVDLLEGVPREPQRLVLPISLAGAPSLLPAARRELARLQSQGRLLASIDAVRPAVAGDRGEAALLAAPDDAYGFVTVANWRDRARHFGPYTVSLGGKPYEIGAFRLAARSTRLIPIGVSTTASHACTACWEEEFPVVGPVKSAGFLFGDSWIDTGKIFDRTEASRIDPFDDGFGAIVIGNPHIFAVLVPNAGARLAALGAAYASTIGLLRDAVDPEPAPSARDYIAAATHPLPAGTFNRAYACVITSAHSPVAVVRCSYDAPDLPSGGARFERTLSLSSASDEIVVHERMIPHDVRSGVHLKSISGFAVEPSWIVMKPTAHAPCFGIYAASVHRLSRLCWRAGDAASVDVQRTRRAAILTLHFSRNDVVLRLGVFRAASEEQARSLVQSNQ